MSNTATAIAPRKAAGDHSPEAHALMERVVIKGDLSQLTPAERSSYYMTVCNSVGLNPLTKPFEYITLNGRLTLYALRNCTDQLRTIHNVSVTEMVETERDDVFIVTCKVSNRDGRTDMAKGAVNISKLTGEALANAMMKAETKAKRRATLSLCGLGFLDETEIEDIPAPAKTLPKKDSREIYTKMQADIDACGTRAELRQWGEDAKDRIAVLPVDWQDHLRLRFQERMVDLGQHEKRTKPPSPELVAGETMDHETGEVVWGEQPPAAPDNGIPGFLDRRENGKPPKSPEATAADVFDGASWLRDLSGAASGCEDFVSFGEMQEKIYKPNLARALPPDRKRAAAIMQEHFIRLNQTVIDAG